MRDPDYFATTFLECCLGAYWQCNEAMVGTMLASIIVVCNSYAGMQQHGRDGHHRRSDMESLAGF